MAKPASAVFQSGHALASGVIGLWPFTENTGTTVADVSGRGTTLTFVDSPTWATPDATHGPGVTTNGTASYLKNAADPFSNADIANATFLLVCSYPGGQSASRCVATYKGQFLHLLSISGGAGQRAYSSVPAVQQFATFGSYPGNGAIRSVAMAYESGVGGENQCYLDGSASGDPASSSTVPIPDHASFAGRWLSFGCSNNGLTAATFTAATFYYAVLWNRKLSPTEMSNMHTDPYVLIRASSGTPYYYNRRRR